MGSSYCYFVSLVMLIMICSACSYDSEKAVKNGDVINMNGPVYNFLYFESFLKSVEAKKTAAVRITNYSIEGDPTIYNLTFNGSALQLEIDRTKHKNRGDDPRKETMTCSDLVEEDGQQVVSYTLEGCTNGKPFTVLRTLKEADDHDH